MVTRCWSTEAGWGSLQGGVNECMTVGDITQSNNERIKLTQKVNRK